MTAAQPATFKFEIKSRFTGAVQFTAELSAALQSEPFSIQLGAAVKIAVFARADLSRANLSGANGIAPEICTDLLMLLDQPGAIRAYKLVNAEGYGPFNGGVKYEVGESVSVKKPNTDPLEQCGAGINVATLAWCLREWRPGYRVLVVEFTAADIACIPTATDGKFRLFRCAVIAEKAIDPVKIGLVKAEERAAA